MSDTTNLRLPYMEAAQAQKHVTHNEALRIIDAISHAMVLDRDLTAPPGSPSDGDRHIIATGASGDWAGKDLNIAAWTDGAWAFHSPREGWLVWVADEDTLLVWDGGQWSATLFAELQNLGRLGVNATADAINRLSVASDAVLFSHDGDDIQAKLNKKAAGDTASFLFQTNWSGRAEIGLTGDDDFHFRVSPDGSAWQDAYVINSNGNSSFSGTITNNRIGQGYIQVADGGYSQLSLQSFRDHQTHNIFYNDAARGSQASPAALQDNDSIFEYRIRGHNGSAWKTGIKITAYTSEAWTASANGARMRFFVVPNGTQNVQEAFRLDQDKSLISYGNIKPAVDDSVSLGASGARFAEVWAANGTIQTSDKREKSDIQDSALGLEFINALRPVSYKWKTGGNDMDQTHDEESGQTSLKITQKPGKRQHYGLIAQDVKTALDNAGVKDFGGWILTEYPDENSAQGLRYDQFIAPIVKAVQELDAKIKVLQTGKYNT